LRAPMLALAEAGFHAVAVDLRGHGDSDKPPRGYDAWTLATDVTNLIRALGHSSAVIVGQGEGGFVAWTAAYRRPRAVRGLVVVGSPHPLATRRAALRDRRQRRALVPGLLADQAPRLPERRLTRDGAAAVEDMLRERSGPGWPETDDFAASAELLRRAMLIPKVAHLSLESTVDGAQPVPPGRPGFPPRGLAGPRPARAGHQRRRGPLHPSRHRRRLGGLGTGPAHRPRARGRALPRHGGPGGDVRAHRAVRPRRQRPLN